jgi:hypothetical protein
MLRGRGAGSGSDCAGLTALGAPVRLYPSGRGLTGSSRVGSTSSQHTGAGFYCWVREPPASSAEPAADVNRKSVWKQVACQLRGSIPARARARNNICKRNS